MKLAVLNEVKSFVREIVGTIASLEGYDHCEMNAVNVTGENQVYVDIFFKDGKAERVWCSRAVSKGIRDKEIAKQHILSLPIGVGTRDDGSQFYQLQMPAVASTPLVIGSEVKPTTFVRKRAKLTLEDLLATV